MVYSVCTAVAKQFHDEYVDFLLSIHCKVSNTCFNLATGYYTVSFLIVGVHVVSIGFPAAM